MSKRRFVTLDYWLGFSFGVAAVASSNRVSVPVAVVASSIVGFTVIALAVNGAQELIRRRGRRRAEAEAREAFKRVGEEFVAGFDPFDGQPLIAGWERVRHHADGSVRRTFDDPARRPWLGVPGIPLWFDVGAADEYRHRFDDEPIDPSCWRCDRTHRNGRPVTLNSAGVCEEHCAPHLRAEQNA